MNDLKFLFYLFLTIIDIIILFLTGILESTANIICYYLFQRLLVVVTPEEIEAYEESLKENFEKYHGDEYPHYMFFKGVHEIIWTYILRK